MDKIPKIRCRLHPEQEVLGLCFTTPCEHPSRLLCFLCTLEKHANHLNDVLELQDIFNFSSKTQQRVWPKDEKGALIREAILSLETVESAEQMDEMFNKVESSLVKELDSQGNEISQQFLNETSTRVQKQSEVQGYFGAFFSLEQISNSLIQLNSGALPLSEFEASVNEFATRIHSAEYKEGCNLDEIFKDPVLNGLVFYNAKQFETEKEHLLNKISELRGCFTYLRMNLAQHFVFQKETGIDSIVEVEAGKRFQMQGQSSIVSSKPLTEGDHTIIIEFNEIHAQDCVYIKLMHKGVQNLEVGVCVSCPSLQGTNISKLKGDFLGNLIQANTLKLRIRVNTQKEQFVVSDMKELNQIKAITQPLKGLQWNLVVSRSNDAGNCELTLLEARWKV